MNGKTDKSKTLLSLNSDPCVDTHQCVSDELNKNWNQTKYLLVQMLRPEVELLVPKWKCVTKTVTHFGRDHYSACVFSPPLVNTKESVQLQSKELKQNKQCMNQ